MLRWTVHLKGGTKSPYSAVVAVGQEVYAFGGYGKWHGHVMVYMFNTVALRWIKLPPVITGGERSLGVPSMRSGYTAVLIEKNIYLWGGCSYCNALYAFDVGRHVWFKATVSGTVPEGRHDHSACVLGKVMYIHGGNMQRGHGRNFWWSGYTNAIYMLDTATMFWTLINIRGTPPPVSSHHSATIFGTKMFVSGGQSYPNGSMNNDVRVFDTESNCWLETSSKKCLSEGLWSHPAFAYNGELYVFRTAVHLDVLWKFNPEKFSWKKLDHGSFLRSMHWMRSCMVGDRILLFGGTGDVHHLYILDLCPSLKTICKLAVSQYSLEQSELPYNIRWELAAMITYRNRKNMSAGSQ